MSKTYCRFCDITLRGIYLHCPKCGKYLSPYGNEPDIAPEPYELVILVTGEKS